MKTYLFMSIFICSVFNLTAQNSTITFNTYKGLTSTNKRNLSDVYHKMKDLNYHYINLVNTSEKHQYSTHRLLQKAKERASIISYYYTKEQNVPEGNIMVDYDGGFPRLSIYKSKSILTPSGELILDENEKQCFNFNTKAEYPFSTQSGNTFQFPPNAFETVDGKQLINENINICIWEFADKKSLVYAGVTTSANGKMLETAGSFYIEASFKGKELRLRSDASYMVNMPSINKHNDMYTYYGGKTTNIVNWEVDKNEPAPYIDASLVTLPENEIIEIERQQYNEYGEVIDGNVYSAWDAPFEDEEREVIDFYELSAGKLGWINCDRFYDIKNPATLAVRVNHKEPLVVRLVFRDINSILPAYSNSNHLDQYEVNGIPKGEKVLLLAYSVKDDNAIFGYKEITIGENIVETLDLNKLSKARFKGAVSELLSF